MNLVPRSPSAMLMLDTTRAEESGCCRPLCDLALSMAPNAASACERSLYSDRRGCIAIQPSCLMSLTIAAVYAAQLSSETVHSGNVHFPSALPGKVLEHAYS